MTGDRYAEMAFLMLAMILPLSALVSRRLPLGETARTVAIWIVIIVGTVFLVTIARGGIAAVRAWVRPATQERRPSEMAARRAETISSTAAFILHNIFLSR